MPHHDRVILSWTGQIRGKQNKNCLKKDRQALFKSQFYTSSKTDQAQGQNHEITAKGKNGWVNAGETQTRKRKYNETLFLFLFFFLYWFFQHAPRVRVSLLRRKNPSKSAEFTINGVWVVPSRRVPRNESVNSQEFARAIQRQLNRDHSSWKKDNTYQDIFSDIEEKVEGGMDVRKAVKRVLPKHKHKFESLFEFDPDVMEDDNPESDGHDSVDAELPSRMPG